MPFVVSKQGDIRSITVGSAGEKTAICKVFFLPKQTLLLLGKGEANVFDLQCMSTVFSS